MKWETSYLIPHGSADGQWAVCEEGGGDSVAIIDNDAKAERFANLIAAAPDMLAALEALFEHCAMVHKHWGDGDNSKQASEAQKAGLAAIAKAKGQS